MTVVALDPLIAVIFVSEREYGRLAPGQSVVLQTDAYPGRSFSGEVLRVSPVFEPRSRQARVELRVPNAEQLLKPGMFVRADTVLSRVDDAVIVPATAVVEREDRTALFMIDEESSAARLVPVEIGVQDGERLQILSPPLNGQVVTLGQQLLEDGSAVTLPEPASADPAADQADQATADQAEGAS